MQISCSKMRILCNRTLYCLALDRSNYKKLKLQGVNVLFGLNITDVLNVVKSKVLVTDHGLHYFKYLEI